MKSNHRPILFLVVVLAVALVVASCEKSDKKSSGRHLYERQNIVLVHGTSIGGGEKKGSAPAGLPETGDPTMPDTSFAISDYYGQDWYRFLPNEPGIPRNVVVENAIKYVCLDGGELDIRFFYNDPPVEYPYDPASDTYYSTAPGWKDLGVVPWSQDVNADTPLYVLVGRRGGPETEKCTYYLWIAQNSQDVIHDSTGFPDEMPQTREIEPNDATGEAQDLAGYFSDYEPDPLDDDDDPVPSPIWTDPSSGLTWEVNGPDGYMEWEDAMAYCEQLTLADMTGWRLPSISELRTLVRECDATAPGGACGATDSCTVSTCWNAPCYECYYMSGPYDGCYGPPELPHQCDWLMSSTVVEDEDMIYIIAFSAADIFIDFKFPGGGYTRCVH